MSDTMTTIGTHDQVHVSTGDDLVIVHTETEHADCAAGLTAREARTLAVALLTAAD